MTTVQCRPGAVADPTDSNTCFMPLRYYDQDLSETLYSWLTYQPIASGASGTLPDPFSAAYPTIDGISKNPNINAPDTQNQNRRNLFQPKAEPFAWMQWVSAIYPNASIYNDGTDFFGPDDCPGGCNYWAHEYNLENVYVEKDPNGNLLPRYPPRKAVYGFVSVDSKASETAAGTNIKYGDRFYIQVNLLDILPTKENEVTDPNAEQKPTTLIVTGYAGMPLLVSNYKTSAPYIFLGKQSSTDTGSTVFKQLADGTLAEFTFVPPVGSTKIVGDLVMSGDQLILSQAGTDMPAMWRTMPFSGGQVSTDDTAISTQVNDEYSGGAHASWYYNNRVYMQPGEFADGDLQNPIPPTTYTQWFPNSTHGYGSECRWMGTANPTSCEIKGKYYYNNFLVPTGSIMRFGINDTEPGALHWFLSYSTGKPQTDTSHPVCSSSDTSCPDGAKCNTSLNLCLKPTPNYGRSQKAIMIAFLVILGVIIIVGMYIGYKVYSKHTSIEKLKTESKLINQ